MGWRLPGVPAATRSSCTSGMHSGSCSGTACQERGDAVGHPRRSQPARLSQRAALAPAGARTPRTGGSASSSRPGRCGRPSAALPACSSSAAGSPGVPALGSRLWDAVSPWEPVGAMGCGGGWRRGRGLTSAPVDGEGLRRTRARLQAVLQAVRWVVAVSASHTPHDAAESCRLWHGEGGTVGARRCEFVDRCHRHKHRHTGCVAHGSSAMLAPPHSLCRDGGYGDRGISPPMDISGAAGKECFLCDLLVWGLGKVFPQPRDTGTHCSAGAALPLSPQWWL